MRAAQPSDVPLESTRSSPEVMPQERLMIGRSVLTGTFRSCADSRIIGFDCSVKHAALLTTRPRGIRDQVSGVPNYATISWQFSDDVDHQLTACRLQVKGRHFCL